MQAINVEYSGEWKIIASTKIELEAYKDQLVHEEVLELPVYQEPQVVQSQTFKHCDELSEFDVTEMNSEDENVLTD